MSPLYSATSEYSKEYEDATDSDATESDQDGHGRVVGNMLTRGGEYVLSACTKLSLVLGGGPGNPMRMLLKSLQCPSCAEPSFSNDTLPPRDAPVDTVLRGLFTHTTCAACGATRGFRMSYNKNSAKSCKAFATLLRGENHSSQYATILYITALASLVPGLSSRLTKHAIPLTLSLLIHEIRQNPRDDLDFLLDPSFRARAVLKDVKIHSIAKEITALGDCIRNAKTWESFKALTRHRALLYEKLLPLLESPKSALVVAIMICTGPQGNEMDFASVVAEKWPLDHFYEEHWTNRAQIYCDTLVRDLENSKDAVLKCMLPALLRALRDNLINNYALRIQYDIGKGQTPIKAPRTLCILRGPDWERLLRSESGLIDRADKEFMQYALEPWRDEYSSSNSTVVNDCMSACSTENAVDVDS